MRVRSSQKWDEHHCRKTEDEMYTCNMAYISPNDSLYILGAAKQIACQYQHPLAGLDYTSGERDKSAKLGSWQCEVSTRKKQIDFGLIYQEGGPCCFSHCHSEHNKTPLISPLCYNILLLMLYVSGLLSCNRDQMTRAMSPLHRCNGCNEHSSAYLQGNLI